MPETHDMMMVGSAIGVVALLAYSSDDYLQRQFPVQVLALRNKVGKELITKVWKGLVFVHLAEGAYTLLTCVRRGWYNPMNMIKWTLSSVLFGIGSLKQLKKHASDVAGLN
jgi:hypothetical protein